MIIEQMDISVSRQEREKLTRALLSLLHETETVQGCACSGLFLGLPSEDVLRMETYWERERDLLRYLQSDTYKKFLLLMELSIAPPMVNFYSVKETQGLELVRATRKDPAEQLRDG